MKSDKYMGMDIHQAMTVVAVLDADGKVILETMVATEGSAILRLVESLSAPLRVTFEETTQAKWLYEVLRTHVTEVIVCDPRALVNKVVFSSRVREFLQSEIGTSRSVEAKRE
jgi:hypothetical protein